MTWRFTISFTNVAILGEIGPPKDDLITLFFRGVQSLKYDLIWQGDIALEFEWKASNDMTSLVNGPLKYKKN